MMGWFKDNSHCLKDDVEFYKDPRDSNTLAIARERYKKPADARAVLVLYTGGTIGLNRGTSQGKPSGEFKSWAEILQALPQLRGTDQTSLLFSVDCIEFRNKIDSSDITPSDWQKIGRVVDSSYEEYEGFVVLHGTDTLAYTASALSFMVQGSLKPIILTGAQISIANSVRQDAEQNLITSLLIANAKYSDIPSVPGVSIFFHDKLLRGNRAKKISTDGFDSFESPNYPVIGNVGLEIEIERTLLNQEIALEHRVFFPDMSSDVGVFWLFPGGDARQLHSYYDLRVVILVTYGLGNASTNAEFLRVVQGLIRQGVVVISKSQCLMGKMKSDAYLTGCALEEVGVLSAGDMTIEATITKAMHLAARYEDPAEVSSNFEENLCGELTIL